MKQVMEVWVVQYKPKRNGGEIDLVRLLGVPRLFNGLDRATEEAICLGHVGSIEWASPRKMYLTGDKP